MKLLLHTCCAPCLIYPLERLSKKGFEVTGFFYNPNIYPRAEYDLRLGAAKDMAARRRLELVVPDYKPQEFDLAVSDNKKAPQRCVFCWRMRLLRSAEFARESGFEFITTTLLVSPYQDQEQLKLIGEKAALRCGVQFYYEDFRPGFRAAHQIAREQGLYCQKYCGCMYSLEERGSKK